MKTLAMELIHRYGSGVGRVFTVENLQQGRHLGALLVPVIAGWRKARGVTQQTAKRYEKILYGIALGNLPGSEDVVRIAIEIQDAPLHQCQGGKGAHRLAD